MPTPPQISIMSSLIDNFRGKEETPAAEQQPAQPERQAGPSSNVSGGQHEGEATAEDGDQSLGGGWAACSLDKPDVHDVSHMSSILQQLQPEAPHPIAQPEQPDL